VIRCCRSVVPFGAATARTRNPSTPCVGGLATDREAVHLRPGTRAGLLLRTASSARSGQALFVSMHTDQLTITAGMVRTLVDEQFPEWAHLPIEHVALEGTTNAVFRIGNDLVARFPLRPDRPNVIRSILETEAAAARELREHTSVPVPEPVAIGEPRTDYPLPWSVQTWLAGNTATVDDPGASVEFAHDLAAFISEVRAIETRGRVFDGHGRGGDLRAHDDWVRTCIARSQHLLPVDRLTALWDRLRQLPRHTPDVMTHGDLIPGNVLVSAGRLVGILDVGGLGPADPALDLVGAWHLLDDERRALLRDDLGCGDLEWERGKAWAFQQSIGLVWYYETSNPTMSFLGRRTLGRIAADEGSS
jgi:aminoglycoside phosphotransferase (APT) family kinase protein